MIFLSDDIFYYAVKGSNFLPFSFYIFTFYLCILVGFTKPDECPERLSESVETKNGKGKKTCQRQCKSDDDCKNERKLCLCDGACGLSCIRPERECPELPDPPHGQVHLTGR